MIRYWIIVIPKENEAFRVMFSPSIPAPGFAYFFSLSLFPPELCIPLILMKIGSWLEGQIASSILTDGGASKFSPY